MNKLPREMQKKEHVKRKTNYSYLIKFTLLPIIPLAVLAFFAKEPNLWISQGLDHFYFEMFSVILSFIVAYYCFCRGFALENKLSVFIGLGFMVAGFIDLLHGTFAVLNLRDISFEAYFIPQTWVAGRIVMGVAMMIAITKFVSFNKSTKKNTGIIRKDFLIFAVALTVITGVFTLISLNRPLPYLVVDFVIHRPYEIISVALFVFALIYFYKNKLYQNNDPFYKGILLTLITGIFVNIISSYSTFVFDTPFNVAHILKNASYFVFILTLAMSILYNYNLKTILLNKIQDLKDVDKLRKEFSTKLEEKLHERNQLKNALDESSIVSIMDDKGLITYVNEKFCTISKYSRNELVGQNPRLLLSGHYPPKFYDDLMNTISKGKVWNGDIKNMSKDGPYYWLKTTIVPFSGKGEMPKQYIAIHTDITKQKKIEKELENMLIKVKDTEKLKDEFSSMMSHELKSPLVPIIGYCDMLKNPNMPSKLTPEQLEIINHIKKNSHHLLRLIGQMLDAQKLDMKRMKFYKAEFKVKEFLTEVQSDLLPLMEDKHIECTVSADNISITSDAESIGQIISNIVRNAVDYVPEKGKIEICAKMKGDKVLFSVKDNGMGIPKEKQGNIFQKFYQTDTTMARKHGGTGLGLVICKGLVEGLGGKMWFDSEEGKGTIFYFELPKN